MRPWHLAWLVPLALAGCEGPRGGDADASTPRYELGEPCTDASQCVSGVCVGTSPRGGVCSRVCEARRDCPTGDNWHCVEAAEAAGVLVCGCQPDGDVEICADGRDNDCDGVTDDCRRCGDVVVAGDDDRHCGECGNACGADETCRGGECRCADRAATSCDGVCVDTGRDERHCGGCGVECDAGSLCEAGRCVCPPGRPNLCGDECVDLSSDVTHCGGCDRACGPGFECIGGDCACPLDRPDRCGDACVDTSGDEQSCGGCGNVCAPGMVCREGRCDCGGTEDDSWCAGSGCVDFDSDPAHCGGCDNACGAGLACVGGVCACPSPSSPDHCPGRGCVDLGSDAGSCGSCGNVCPSGLSCVGGVCACRSSTQLLCDGTCVVPRWDAANCGGCGRTCRPGERCLDGACTCDSGMVCDGVCERDSTAHCGGCGVACAVGEVCASGRCACPSSGETHCGDGCHHLSTSSLHCGACGNACLGGQYCASGSCRCPSGQTWCEALGRCVDLRSDAASCGACGNACEGDEVCSSGTCRCPTSGDLYCASTGACTPTWTNDLHCGACDNACPAGTACVSGTCRCPGASERVCGGACVDIASDDAHCGACDQACAPGASCAGYRCACDVAGETLCATGCVDLNDDPAHCGACDAACVPGQACVGGACSCPPPTLGAQQRLAGAIDGSFRVQLASNGTSYAAVWAERLGSDYEVRFRLLDATGAPLSELALKDPSTPGFTAQVDVVWTGSGWAVVWVEHHGAPTNYVLAMRLVAPDGRSAGPPSIAPLGTPRMEGLRLVHTPTLGVVAAGLDGIKVLGDGSAPRPLLGIGARTFDVAADPAGALAIVYSTSDGLYHQRIEPDGSRLAPRDLVQSDMTPPSNRWFFGQPAIGWTGSDWVVAYMRRRWSPRPEEHEVVACYLSDCSSPLLIERITQAAGADELEHTALDVRGGRALVGWSRSSGSFRFRRLDLGTTLRPLDAPFRTPSTDTAYPLGGLDVLFTSDDDALVAWTDVRWGDHEPYAQSISLSRCAP